VRWQRLFDDLEAQLRAAESAGHDADVLGLAAVERARQSLVARLAAGATPVELVLAGGARVRGAVVHYGADWLALSDGSNEVLVLAHAITQAAAPVRSSGDHASKLGLRTLLRGLARRRCYVQAGLSSGQSFGGTTSSWRCTTRTSRDEPRTSGPSCSSRSVRCAGSGTGSAERVLRDEVGRVVVQALDVLLQLARLDPPLTATTDLHRRQVAGADQGVRLRRGDAQLVGDIGEGEEARGGHRGSLAPGTSTPRPRLWTVAAVAA